MASLSLSLSLDDFHLLFSINNFSSFSLLELAFGNHLFSQLLGCCCCFEWRSWSCDSLVDHHKQLKSRNSLRWRSYSPVLVITMPHEFFDFIFGGFDGWGNNTSTRIKFFLFLKTFQFDKIKLRTKLFGSSADMW
jgi:hypothetical protein